MVAGRQPELVGQIDGPARGHRRGVADLRDHPIAIALMGERCAQAEHHDRWNDGRAGDHPQRTVAEGVESREAWDLLHEFGCDEAQGYLLSRPLPAGHFTAWLSRQNVRMIDHGDAVVPFNPRSRRRAVNDHD